jgi:hypothetical protein
LNELPTGFTYRLGNVGWSDSWSYRGFDPSHLEFRLDGISVRDAATHRALLEMAPVDAIESPGLTTTGSGSTVLLQSRVRPFEHRRPYTELRYRNGGAGFQFISATHVQRRRLHILGAPTVTQFVVRFGFHEWNGQYPNSDSDLSQVFARIGFTSRRWRVRFTNSYSLRSRGAHSGVLEKPGQGFDSVYERFNASVGDPTARQRHQRNQFDVSAEHTWLTDMKPLAIRASYIRSLYRYSRDADTENRASEFHLNIEQEAPEFIRGHELTGRFSFETASISSDGLLSGGGGAAKSRMIVSLSDRFALLRGDSRVTLGLHGSDDWVYPSASLQIMKPAGRLKIRAEAGLNGRAPSPLERVGGLDMRPLDDSPGHTRTENLQLSIADESRPLAWSLSGFLSRLVDPIDLARASEDGGYNVVQLDGSVTWIGLSAEVGWRTRQTSGLYGVLGPTVQQATSSSTDPVASLMTSTLPKMHGFARFGYRNQFFKGDLDLDLYVVGHLWTSFRSRVYNTIHSVTSLPGLDEAEVRSSGTLDLRLAAGIREATLFLSFDNILADLAYPGALVVPVYPLPAQIFRFGVLWPIWG